MNSSQRRKAKREHPHVITIRTEAVSHYYEHDEKVQRAAKWCKKHCKGSWKTDARWDLAEFKFANHKDAMIFALKWV